MVSKDESSKWSDKAESFVDSAVEKVNKKVLRPANIAVRVVAFSAILIVVGIFSFVFFTIGLFRFMNTYLFASHQWLSYLSVGAWFVLVGLFLYRFRISRKQRRS